MARPFVFITFDNFFDRAKVERATNGKERRVLSGTGAFARTVIRRSMRKGGKEKKINLESTYVDASGRRRAKGGRFVATTNKGISKPGEPPRYYTKILRDGILFAYEPQTKSVIVGARANNNNKPNGSSNRQTVPELLEFGGTVRQRAKTITLGTSRTKKRLPSRTLKYRPRPYIAPATPLAAAKMRDLMKR